MSSRICLRGAFGVLVVGGRGARDQSAQGQRAKRHQGQKPVERPWGRGWHGRNQCRKCLARTSPKSDILGADTLSYACSVPRLLRNPRRHQNGHERRHPQSLPQAGAPVPSRRGQGQKDRRGKIQADQRGLRGSERRHQTREIRPAWLGLAAGTGRRRPAPGSRAQGGRHRVRFRRHRLQRLFRAVFQHRRTLRARRDGRAFGGLRFFPAARLRTRRGRGSGYFGDAWRRR